MQQDADGPAAAVFVSTGGTFSPRQILGIMACYPNALAVDCFDNDLAGRIFGMRMAALLWGVSVNIIRQDRRVIIETEGMVYDIAEKDCTLPYLRKKLRKRGRVMQCKPPMKWKDWNDVAMSSPADD